MRPWDISLSQLLVSRSAKRNSNRHRKRRGSAFLIKARAKSLLVGSVWWAVHRRLENHSCHRHPRSLPKTWGDSTSLSKTISDSSLARTSTPLSSSPLSRLEFNCHTLFSNIRIRTLWTKTWSRKLQSSALSLKVTSKTCISCQVSKSTSEVRPKRILDNSKRSKRSP